MSEIQSLFARVIQDHLELKERNSELDPLMPIDRYTTDDPFGNHPLFKSEEQARFEETLGGTEPAVAPRLPGIALAGEETEANGNGLEDSLWGRSREFDWGD